MVKICTVLQMFDLCGVLNIWTEQGRIDNGIEWLKCRVKQVAYTGNMSRTFNTKLVTEIYQLKGESGAYIRLERGK